MHPSSLFHRLRPSATKSPITPVCQVCTSFAGALIVLTAALLVAGTSIPAASAQTVAYAGSGAVNFGSVNVCPSGKTTPAPCSETLTLTYNVTASGTLGTPQVLTTGLPNLDYKLAGGSTCSGSVTKGDTCKVNVTFAPIAPGPRNGAVEIVNSSGNLLATNYIYGSGIGPLVGFTPPAPSPIEASFSGIGSLAVDASGDVFIVDSSYGALEEVVAVNGSIPPDPVVNLLNNNYLPVDLALDGAGNVFYTTTGPTQDVVEIPAADGYYANKVIASGLSNPQAIAVDGSGNIFFVEYGDGSSVPPGVKEILASSGYTTIKTLPGAYHFTGIGRNTGYLAVDGSGNLFVSDYSIDGGSNIGVVDELSASDGYSTVKTIEANSPGSVPTVPYGIAVDPAGNLFAAFGQDFASIGEFFAVDGVLSSHPSSSIFDLYYSFSIPAIAIDGRGNIFGYSVDDTIEEVQFSTTPPLSFANTIVGQTSSDSPQSVKIQNQGNAALDLSAISINPNWQIVPGSGTPADCRASASLAPDAVCNLSISFKPTVVGALTGAVTVGDNTLNAAGSTQSIALNGTAVASLPVPHITSVNTTYGAPYSVVFVTGTNFGTGNVSNKVTFNGVAAPVFFPSSTFLAATVPPKSTTGNLVVTVNGQASNPVDFTVLPQPKVTGISPTSGPVGTVVTISGTNLLDYESKGAVTFDGKSLPLLSDSSAAIKVAIPAGAVSDDFHVLVNDTGINTPTFTVTP